MKSPTISVIMSVYNDETFVEMAIISLLVQTFSDFEVIIIDDGSSDNTAELIERIKDPRIVLIKRQNSGLTKSLNYALSRAKGKWIARQDADDMSIYTRFEQQIAFLEKHPEVKLLGTSQFVIPKYNLVNEVFFFPTEDEGIRNA
ncbi:glycosyltransferase family 2 protein, partial [bacterium]|nr:glycosyltransferase family 2 protein [bacterium]